MRLYRTLVFLQCCGAAAFLAGPAVCGNFVAEQTASGTLIKGKAPHYKLAVDGSKVRQEIQAADGSMRIRIARPDRGVMLLVDPAHKEYMEMKVPAAAFGEPGNDKEIRKVANRKIVGSEVVSGQTCEKRLYIAKEKPQGSMMQWWSQKLGWPIKTEIKAKEGNMVTLLKNIKTGAATPAMFDVPKGYKKVVPKKPAAKPKPR